MNTGHDRSIDLNLLAVLVAVVRERSVSNAARSLALSQSAVSHALARLRRAVGDPLFVRIGQEFQPTQRALALFDVAAPALAAIAQEVRGARLFDPAAARVIFRAGLSDDLLIAILPRLLARLKHEAPMAQLVVRTTDYLKASDMLNSADVSLVVGYLAQLPAHAKVRVLRTSGYRVLRASRGPMTLDAYCAAEHILVIFAGDLRGYIDESLEGLGRQRTIAVSVPQFAILPSALCGTTSCATVPDHVARSFVLAHGLHDAPLPFESPTFDVSMAWSSGSTNDAAEAWFRALVAACVVETWPEAPAAA